VHLYQAIDAALRMLESHLRYRATVEVTLGEVPPVLANSQRLVQVVVNLLNNALESLPERGSSENLIRITTALAPSGQVALEVSDSGGGIPDSVRDRIFDPFFTTKGHGSGTGLGLYLCHQFVTSFGGTIDVTATSKSGTTLRVLLNVAAQAESARASPPPAPLPRSRILVVDDEPLVARAIQRSLRDHDLVVAGDGERALDLCRRGSFDLILCDMMMPRMDGAAFHEALAAHRPELVGRVVFMTGGAFTEAARRFLDTVDAPRLDKPVDAEKLLTVARSIVLGRSGA
jgi:CheY-like chemotaxis protein